MGLDMYLNGVFKKDGHEIREELICWRKCNQIHYWFVDNIQDGEDNCLSHCCEIDDLIELRDICEEILNDNSKAEELLPTYEGSFFGTYEYDAWYFEDIKWTYEKLDRIIKEDKYDYFEYQSCW